jgi:hypothetical protein
MLSETAWKNLLSSGLNFVGKRITANNVPVTVIEVAESDAANVLIAGIFFPKRWRLS